MILQMALGLQPDGVVGPATRAVLAVAERDPERLLQDLRAAREKYERRKRDEQSPYWKGLVNRWNNALKFARTFLPAAPKSAAKPRSRPWPRPRPRNPPET